MAALTAAHLTRYDTWKATRSFLQRQPAEQLVPYQNSSLASPVVAPLVSVTADEWMESMNTVLSAGPSRNIFFDQIERVSENLEQDLTQELQESKPAMSEQEFFVAKHPAWNLLAKVPGTSKDGRFVLLGAHYDSLPAKGNAPGAEDNGSGVAAVLSAAAKLEGKQPKRDMYFALFSAEEQGLLGSAHFVQELIKSGHQDKFDGAIILDEVSYSKDKKSKNIIFETSGQKEKNNRIIDTLALAAQKSTPDVSYQVNYHGFGSDHMSFLDHGLPAVLVIEADNMYFASEFGHTSQDTVDKVVPALGADVATIAANALLSLADA